MEVWSQKKMWMVMAMVTLSLIGKISSLSVTVNEVECVYEYVLYEGDTVSGNFVVVDNDIFWSSDHPGIDFTVTSPAGNVVQTLKGVSREKFDFKAPRSGMYKFCFHNPYSTPETVSFYIHVGHIPNEHDLAKDEHLDPVNVKIAELREALESVTAEQKYLKARDSRHRHKSGIVQASTLRVLIEESNDTEKAKEVANSTSYKALSPSGPDPSPDYTNMSDTNLANSTSYNSLGALSPSGADPYHDCINRSNTTGATCGNP